MSPSYSILDTESTIYEKGNPFSLRNRLCLVGLRGQGDTSRQYPIEYESDTIYGPNIQDISQRLERPGILVGFNIKHDLHWIRRYGISYYGKLWDCQLAEHIISGLNPPYPSLDGTCDKYKLGRKKTEVGSLWEQGVDTPDIDWDMLISYNDGDLVLTEKLFLWQLNYLKDKPKLKRLIWLCCQDIIETAEMEWNGIRYDFKLSQEKGNEVLGEIQKLDKVLGNLVDGIPINWNSGDHISAYLYGGVVKWKEQESYTFAYKSGETKEKVRWVTKTKEFPRLVQPLPRTELKKDGYFRTDITTLRSLDTKGRSKEAIGLLLDRTRLEKQVSTYYQGLPELHTRMDWEEGFLHPTLNHCVTRTSRLSSSRPNSQNLDDGVLECVISRFK